MIESYGTPAPKSAPLRLLVVGLTWLCLLSLVQAGSVAAETLTLQRALDIAFAGSPDIRQAGYNLEASAQNLKAQQASLKSQISLSLMPFSYSNTSDFDSTLSAYRDREIKQSGASFRIDQRIKWTDGMLSLVNDFNWQKYKVDALTNPFAGAAGLSQVEETLYDNELSLVYTQPLFTYNRTAQTLRRLELALENAQLSYDLQRLSLEYQVTQLFYSIHRRHRSVEIAQEEYDNTLESYTVIKNKVEAGISAEEELYQAELNLANARSSRENSQVAYENALDDFKIALGLPLEEELDVVADIEKAVVEVDLEQAVSNALKYRMELRQRDISIQNAIFDVVQAGADNEFRGSVSLSYGIFGSAEEFSDLYRSPTKNQGVSLWFNIPLWDWGEKRSRIAAGEAQLESSRLARDEESKQIVFDIRQSYRNLQNLLTQIDIAETSVRNAELTYDIALERYRNGDISSKDIGEYQTQLSQQQLNHLSALINYKLALLDMKIKSLWDFERGQPVLNSQMGAQR